MKEFNLSDKLQWGTLYGGEEANPKVIFKDDLKEFIKRLKDEVKNNLVLNQDEFNGEVLFYKDLHEAIDKLAGPLLTEARE